MEDLLKEIVSSLNNNGDKAEQKDGNIIVETVINDIAIQMTCKLGSYFPYEFPTVFLSQDTWAKLPSMPHKYTDGSICTYDKSVSIPNFNKPVLLVQSVINKAKEVIKFGIEGTNKEDYIDEFLEYWITKSHENAQAFIQECSKTQELFWVKDDSRSIIADSVDRANSIFNAALGKEPKEFMKGLLVPIRSTNDISIPKTDTEFLGLLMKNATSWKDANAFFQKNINLKQFFILVSEEKSNGGKLFGWIFKGPGVPNGFRKGHANLILAFSKSKHNGLPLAVDNCEQKRLYVRGGDGKQVNINNVIIIGCGSIGSVVTEALRDCGIQNFTLVDNDILSYENIARHYAGFFWVGKPKVDAIKINIQLHNPNLVIKTYNENAFSFFQTQQELINQSDMVVLAVASAPVEQHFIKMINESLVSVPTVIIWVEPYAIAGHAILINHSMDFYQEIFDRETLDYQYNVLKKPEQYSKRESGCQTTYMPYSVFGLKEMVYRIMELCIKDYLHRGHNYRFTWCGRLSEARKDGIEISSRYSETADYSLEVERID